jgi:hypothetical protein
VVAGVDRGVLVFEEAFGDGEAEPGSAVLAGGGRASADAGFEDVGEEVGVDPGSLVFDGDLDACLGYRRPFEVDWCAGGAVAQGVLEDVGEGALGALAVDADGERLVDLELECVVSEAGGVLEAGCDLVQQVGDRNCLEVGGRLRVVVAV